MSGREHASPPLLRVVRGEPTDAELAAVTAALTAAARAAARPPQAGRDDSAWADPASRLRRPLHPGPGAWQRSAPPH